ncbi:hypothetical protein KOI40_05850 [Aestuariicella sp. G3-2]|nr:hypothetical protein [Aestuariicella albida]MBU3069336.1 hypothetical protein [Aestuariicella albida]
MKHNVRGVSNQGQHSGNQWCLREWNPQARGIELCRGGNVKNLTGG